MKFDHHMHTKRHSPDSEIDPVAPGRACPRDWPGRHGDHRARLPVGSRRTGRAGRAGGPAPRVFRSRDLGREGHFLVYGLPSLEEVPAGVALADLLDRP